MNIQDIKPAEGAKTSTKRVGRGIGSGTGKTSTRGHKGQWARSGGGVRPNFEGGQMPLTRRLPKIGFNNKRFAHVYNAVNVDVFNRYNDGDVVDIERLVADGVIKKVENYGLKVMGDGELQKKLVIKANKFTASAIQKIEKAGGTAEVL
ncbi:MAG: 50S ribosomal protein L15 [Bacteroides sp.]|nr:50S ribosomal protein L15 [Bacillota bacterium]MCM1393981.1 50S ribosomal protein L15 [[Eubacterium] siraeum]MCM1455695.1 50S ribosomal protein L15 [Bacteroides sp.]